MLGADKGAVRRAPHALWSEPLFPGRNSGPRIDSLRRRIPFGLIIPLLVRWLEMWPKFTGKGLHQIVTHHHENLGKPEVFNSSYKIHNGI